MKTAPSGEAAGVGAGAAAYGKVGVDGMKRAAEAMAGGATDRPGTTPAGGAKVAGMVAGGATVEAGVELDADCLVEGAGEVTDEAWRKGVHRAHRRGQRKGRGKAQER
jgi:hypothetical protein